MTDLWPWVTLAGAGALHGLNPANGWLPAVACSGRGRAVAQAHARDGQCVLRGLAPRLLPMAVGHTASIGLVAALLSQGWPKGDIVCCVLPVAMLLAAIALLHARRRGVCPWHSFSGGRGVLALWSFAATTVHGTGMMLLPVWVPICLSDSPAKAVNASGSLLLGLAAAGVHLAAMLAAMAAAAAGTRAGLRAMRLGWRWVIPGGGLRQPAAEWPVKTAN